MPEQGKRKTQHLGIRPNGFGVIYVDKKTGKYVARLGPKHGRWFLGRHFLTYVDAHHAIMEMLMKLVAGSGQHRRLHIHCVQGVP